MMTMHAAKGLEFPNVFLVGLEEGLFPSNRCMSEPEELEEERRLCYVAITRAKQHLVITYARQRMLYGRTTTNLPSRFVDERNVIGIMDELSLAQRDIEANVNPRMVFFDLTLKMIVLLIQ